MLIVHGTLLVQDPVRRLVRDGAVRIQGERIVELGTSAELLARYPDDERLDAGGMIVMPGLVSAHARPYTALALGCAFRTAGPGDPSRTPRDAWRRIASAMEYDEIRYATLVSCLDAVRHGVTTLLAMHTSPRAMAYALDAVAEAALQVGVRMSIAYEVSDRDGTTAARQAIQENARFANRVRNEPLLAASMGLGKSATLSNETLRAAIGAAAVADIGFHMQVADEPYDEQDAIKRYNQRVVERLARSGVLGPRTLLTDCVHLSLEEMGLIPRRQSWVVHNPRSNMYDATGLAPIGDLLKRGVAVCLGTDGYKPDLFTEMRVAHLLHRYATRNPDTLPAERIVEMALVRNPALASRIFRDRLGELAVGALADILLVDYPAPTPMTEANLGQHVVLGIEGAHVDTVIIAGRVVMRHRAMLALDEEAIRGRARDAAQRLWTRL